MGEARATHLHIARVLLAESIRRGRAPFAHQLLTWAGERRRLAGSDVKQWELFA